MKIDTKKYIVEENNTKKARLVKKHRKDSKNYKNMSKMCRRTQLHVMKKHVDEIK